MRLIKQQALAWAEPELNQDSDHYLDYYSSEKESEPMDIIQTFIADIPHPVIIVDNITDEIAYFNDAADDDIPLFGKPLHEVVQIFGEEITSEPVGYLNGKWFNVYSTAFNWNDKRLTKYEFKHRQIMPDQHTLEGWKNMIQVMLHRFRSPLTGVKGYLHILEDENRDKTLDRRINSIQGGLDRVFAIMDEMELLYHIKENDMEQSPESSDIQQVIYSILKKYPADVRKKISYFQSKEKADFKGSKANIQVILEALIQNAVDNTSAEDDSISIEVHPNRFIKITNSGKPIPEDIQDRVFSPFVTTKAENIGIGLTTAMMHADQFGGAIFLSQNSAENGISFTVCFPS